MNYEEMFKGAVRFSPVTVGGRIRRLFGMAPRFGTQSGRGQLFDKMMAEFVTSNPAALQQATSGNLKSLRRSFQKHQGKFTQGHGLDPSAMAKYTPTSDQVLAAQVKRHSKRVAAGRSSVAPAPAQPAGSRTGKALTYTAIGTAGGMGLASRLSDGNQPQQAGYYGGGGYGH